MMISPQSVSKWENDIGYPDLPLLAPISEIFGVSIDYLLGKSENTKAAEIKAAKERTLELWRDESDSTDENIAIWRGLLKKYPTDNECRNELAFQLTAGWKEMPKGELEAAAREAAALYETVLDESTDSGERSFALTQLVWAYGTLLGETELAKKHAKRAGNMYCNTPHLMTSIPDHPERRHWQQYEVWYMTCGLAWAIADQKYERAEDAIFAYRTALKIIDAVCYDAPHAYFDSYFSAYFRRLICEKRARLGDLGEGIYEDLEAMLESCRRADSMALGRHYFEGNIFLDSVYYETSLHDSEMRFAKELLESPLFDSIRDDARFKALNE